MKLGKGINYSRYCWQWRGTEALNFTDYMDPDPNGGLRDQISPARISEASTHVALINHLGFDTIRLPITFHCWISTDTNLIEDDHRYWVVLDNMISACQANNLNLVISYHHAPTSADFARPLAIWQQIAQRPSVLNAGDNVVFEIFNEADASILNADLKTNYINLINDIRTIPQHANRWMVVGGNNWNDIGFENEEGVEDAGLMGFSSLNLPNIIYTFHSYEPKLFTNQGFIAEPCYQTTGISFPVKQPLPPFVSSPKCETSPGGFNEGQFKYDNYAVDNGNKTGFGMGSVPFLIRRINDAKAWSVRNGDVPLWCGEWGCHRSLSAIPDDGSIERFISAMLIALKAHDVDWCWWDFEGPFTIFDPVPDVVNLPDSFGVVTCTNDTLSPLIRKLMKLSRPL
ncbi:glycoside hydrolase family 5 protein [Spirosoma sp. KNUC1025]|uniref:glycoside hydrolase family 5 protein n=1 Tax=Spirosoma sp. KNUC1025 TaxID=2894082 RepID=UPI00386BDCB0|nr:glycoside hydrolase family 5 protein [Spirosoma sp. KNUC1025]